MFKNNLNTIFFCPFISFFIKKIMIQLPNLYVIFMPYTYKKRNSYYFKTKIAMDDNLAKKDVIYYAIVLKDLNGFWIYTLTPNLGKN